MGEIEVFDRGQKCERYQTWNPSLVDYLLISQDEPRVEKYTRQAEGGWSFDRFAGLSAVVPLPSIRCTFKLQDVYDRVSFASKMDEP